MEEQLALALNRTILELKQFQVVVLPFAYYLFKSYHFGIETEVEDEE